MRRSREQDSIDIRLIRGVGRIAHYRDVIETATLTGMRGFPRPRIQTRSPVKTLLFLLISTATALCQAPPATVTKTLTSGSTSLTVNFTLHPIRSANFNVQVQDATGNFTPYTADVPRTYIGTVTGRPGAIAAGYQKANGTFWSYIAFEDGKTWSSSGTTASAGGGDWTPNVYPTTGVGAGGAGSAVKAAELGIDASYREWQAVGSNMVNLIDMVEFCAMKANIVYLRDTAILHRVGRIVVRTDAAKCPYQALPASTTDDWGVLLNTMKTQWNTTLPPILGASAHDVASLVRPGVGGGLASVGVIGTSSRYSITGATSSGDFLGAWRHELGHNWSSSHYEGGGKPEGPTIMSDNSLARFSSSEATKIINHRNSKSSVLDNLGAYSAPLPPRAFGDRVTMSSGALFTVVDVLANDSDSNGEVLSLVSSDAITDKKSLVLRSVGTGPSGRDQLIYYAPPGYSSGYDYFNYRIQDTAGYQGIAKVYVNPVKLPSLPPLWTSSDIGAVGATGDAGAEGGTHVVYGSGADIWGTADEFRFVRQTANGDCDLRARVSGQADTNGYAKAGVMLRDGTAAGAAHASIYVTPSNGFAFQYRSATGGSTNHVSGPALNVGPNNWVRLTRVGNLLTSYVSADGVTWAQVGTATITMPATLQAGLAVTSHVDATLGGVVFDRVSLSHDEPSVALLQDTFNGTAANDTGEALDAGWSGATMTVASDSTLGGGNALNVDGGTYAGAGASFAGRSLLNDGDILKLSFDFRYTQTPGNLAAGFRFGLFNNSGDGFVAHHGTGGNGSWSINDDGGSDGSFGFGGLSGVTSGSKASLNDQAKHTVSLLLRKTSTGMTITATVDGVSLSGSDTNPSTLDYDRVLITNGNITGDFRVDNVRVEAFQLVPPAFTSDPISKPTAAIGTAYTGTLTANVNSAHPGHTYEKTAGPAWLTVASNGSFSGTPAAGDVAANSFTVKVTSELGTSDEATLQVPVAYPVSLAASDATASEDDLSTGTFTLTRSGPTTADLTVNFSLSGTAESGSDFASTGTSVVIPAGQSSAAVTVSPLDDALLEPAETVILTLAASSSYALGSSSTATVTINDDESLFIRMNDGFDSASATAGNDGDDPFDAAWTGSGATLSVASDTTINSGKSLNVDVTASYSGVRGAFSSKSLPVNGDSITLSFDFRYTAAPTDLSGGLRFGLYNAAGAGFCVHHGTGGNAGLGLLESPSGGFGAGSGMASIATGSKATINDQTKHTMSLKLTRTAAGILATSTVDGITHSGTDTTPVITSFDTVSITNGNQTVDFRLDNVRVEFSPNLAPAFTSNPLVKSAVVNAAMSGSLAADTSDPNPGDTVTFAKMAGPSWLGIASNGTLSGTPTAAEAGANAFTVRLTDQHGVFADASLIVNVGHPLTVAASIPVTHEPAGLPGGFVVTRGGPTTSAMTIHYALGGTAIPDEDYVAPSGSAVIPSGQTSVMIPFTPLDDALFEDSETVILSLSQNAAYAVASPGNATVTIADDETLEHAIEDTFDVGAAPTAGNDSDDADDAAWTASGGSLSVAEDATFDTGKALLVDATSTFPLTRANFATVALSQPGDSLRLRLDFRYTQAPMNVGSGLRFGLFNAAGDGFLVQHGIGGSTGWYLAEDHGADNGFGSGGTVTTQASGSKTSINDQAAHTLALTLTRTATGIAVVGAVDDSLIQFTDTTPVTTAFEVVGIRHGNLTVDFAIDNVHVEVVRNRAPFFTSQPLVLPAASADEAYAGSVADEAVDPNDGDALTFSKIAGPAWLAVAADGSLSGTPTLADTGSKSFTLRVTDPHGLSSDATLLIEAGESQPPIEAWRDASFESDSSNAAIAGNDADPDGDGLSNLVEYALGLDPNAPSTPPAAQVAGGVLSITYTVNLLATDVSIATEWSGDLATWDDTGITLETLGETGSLRTVRASIPAGSACRFLHLKVTEP
jgi:hypothetical protein